MLKPHELRLTAAPRHEPPNRVFWIEALDGSRTVHVRVRVPIELIERGEWLPFLEEKALAGWQEGWRLAPS